MKLSMLGAPRAGEVEIRGVKIAVKPPPQAVLDVVYALFERPVAPLGQNPNRGSLAPPEPMDHDPAHLRALREWNRTTDYIEIALCIDLEVDDMGRFDDCRERPKAWCEKAARAVAEAFTREELVKIAEVRAKIERGVEEVAVKN